MGAVFAPTRFSLVRISVRDLVADGKSLLRNSGVGGGGENLVLTTGKGKERNDDHDQDPLPKDLLHALGHGPLKKAWRTFRIFFIFFSARGGGRGSPRRQEGGGSIFY